MANLKLVLENGLYCDDQHEIPHLFVKNQNFSTLFENHHRNLVAHWSAHSGHAPVPLEQNLGNFVTDIVPSSNLPWDVPTITNQAQKSYAAALSCKSVISQAERNQ